MEDQDANNGKWHLIKGVSLPTLFMLLMQTGALIWYAAQFTFEQRAQGARLTTVEVKMDKVVDNSNASIGPAAVSAAKMSVLESQVNTLLLWKETMRDEMVRLRVGGGQK